MSSRSSVPALRRYRGAVLLLAVCVAFLFQGTRGLFETTEGRYAEVGREMVAGGDWMVPHLDGHPHWTKPPLTYWSIAAGLVTVGRNTWGARLYDSFALVVTTIMVAALGATLWDELTGLIAGLIFVTIPFVVMGANVVSPDMLLTCFETIAVLCYWRSMRAGETDTRSSRLWMAGMGAAFGLAFLTKGPPGLLPLLAILIFSFISRRRGVGVPRLVSITGIALFVVMGLAWYIVSIVNDPSLLNYLLGKEVYGRVATGMYHRNSEWYMALVIFGLPLLFGLGAWLVSGILDARRVARARGGWRPAGSAAMHKPEWLFLVLWIVAPLVVFSVSKSRLPLYVLPLVPAQAILAARLAVHAAGAEKALQRTWRIAIVSAVVLVGVKFASARVSSPSNMLPLAKEIRTAHADRVTVVDNTLLFGLQFYLDGALHRTTSAALAAELDASAARLENGTSHRELLLTGRDAPPLLSRRCGNDGLNCRVQASPDHQLWILEGKSH